MSFPPIHHHQLHERRNHPQRAGVLHLKGACLMPTCWIMRIASVRFDILTFWRVRRRGNEVGKTPEELRQLVAEVQRRQCEPGKVEVTAVVERYTRTVDPIFMRRDVI